MAAVAAARVLRLPRRLQRLAGQADAEARRAPIRPTPSALAGARFSGPDPVQTARDPFAAEELAGPEGEAAALLPGIWATGRGQPDAEPLHRDRRGPARWRGVCRPGPSAPARSPGESAAAGKTATP